MLLILDVDGTMTDGTKTYTPNGEAYTKRFADHDFTAIKKFQENGWHVCWLSADMSVNEYLAKYRKIDFWYSRSKDGTINKIDWLHKLSEHYSTGYEQIVYVGDDLYDLPLMAELHRFGGKSFCPKNAVPQMDMPGYITRLNVAGGSGAIMELLVCHFPGENVCSPPIAG